MTDLLKPPDAGTERKSPGGKALAKAAGAKGAGAKAAAAKAPAAKAGGKPVPAQPGLLFHEPWWLDAVTLGQCQEVRVTSGEQVVGRLPFVISRKMGFTSLRMPPFTHLLGPAVDPGQGKPQTQMLKRMSIVRDLIDQLPKFDYFKQALSASTADGLAFQDRGYEITPQYTFRINCSRDTEQVWQDMHFKTRQHIRRAEEKFRVSTVSDAGRFIEFYTTNVQKQGLTNNIDFTPFGTVLSECQARGCGEILCASWPDGTPTAMVFLVWGHGTMYYLLSTRASDAGDNGSVNLLLWTAIQRAHALGLVLDLDGVSTSGTARFLSRFGGSMEMRLIVRRSKFLYTALQSTKRRLLGGRADQTTAFT
jgi:hypothetical protein